MDPITGGHDAPASTSTLVTGLAALGTMVCVGIFVLLATVFTAWAEKVGLVDWLVRCCTGHVDPAPRRFRSRARQAAGATAAAATGARPCDRRARRP